VADSSQQMMRERPDEKDRDEAKGDMAEETRDPRVRLRVVQGQVEKVNGERNTEGEHDSCHPVSNGRQRTDRHLNSRQIEEYRPLSLRR
jgi:hypothetical protein